MRIGKKVTCNGRKGTVKRIWASFDKPYLVLFEDDNTTDWVDDNDIAPKARYRIDTRSLTIRNLMEDGAPTQDIKNLFEDFDADDIIPIDYAISYCTEGSYASSCKIDFLVRNSYIALDDTKAFKIGDVYTIGRNKRKYKLSLFDKGTEEWVAFLQNMDGRNRWSYPVPVEKGVTEVSEQQFKCLLSTQAHNLESIYKTRIPA